MTVIRLDTRSEHGDEPVVTSYSAGLYRGVGVEGPDTRIDQAPEFPRHAPAPSTEKVEIFIAPAHVYTECAHIWNPIHTERRVALAAGLPDIVLHGTATWALAAREIIDLFAHRDPLRLRRLAGQFRALVTPGSTITFEGGRRGRSMEFTVRNSAGAPAIASGRALIDSAG